jgi:excinuclease UvrABC ATPase subunit
MDEPTIELAMSDISRLLQVIGPNFDNIQNADWISELRLEGGCKGTS